MQSMGGPIIKDIVLVGAGHAHVQVLRTFAMAPLPGVRLTLITREVDTPYSGMLPGLIAGHYTFDEAHIDTGPLTRFAKARLYKGEVIGLDLEARRIVCRDRPPVPYDLLSLDIGSTPNTADVPGAVDHAIPVKPIDGFLARFEALRQRVIANRGRARIAFVGAGAGGVELLLSVERRLRRDVAQAGGDPAALSFVLISSSSKILPTFPAAFRARLRRILEKRGILCVAGSPVARVERECLILTDLTRIAADEILWTTQARAAPWLAKTGLPLDAQGFIRVDSNLRVEGRDDVFAAGDTITFPGRALPHSGVYAVRAGPPLAENLRRTLTGAALRPFKPQGDAMYLVSTGEAEAVGTRNGIAFAGAWVWRWKDWIDRRFMRMFAEFPEMPATPGQTSPLADKDALRGLTAITERCGGCGAKVGADALSRALGDITPFARGDVLLGLDAPDDAAMVDTGGPKASVHSVDYFRAMFDDPFVFGKIAANHALGDLFAMGAEPQSALAIATLPYGLEVKVEADLAAMMAGANETLRDAGCALVGGHTSEGAELALGFSVNGLVARDMALRKSGLTTGDALILTKPLGTGALLAAHMRGKARARHVMAAIAHMIQSSSAAAHILRAHGAHAATDVTGFGLLGHLVEMLRASEVTAELALPHVPLLDGVIDAIGIEIFSSLQPQNLRLRRAIANQTAASAHPLFPVVFDPQTAGGLLVGLPWERADAAIIALRGAGYSGAAIIGRVLEKLATPEPLSILLEG